MLSKIRFYIFAGLILLTIFLGGFSCCSCKKMYKYKAEKESVAERLKMANLEMSKKDSVINTLSKVLPAKIDTVKIEVIKEVRKTDTLVLYNTKILQRIDTNVLLIKKQIIK